jgi:hypothetical protein
MPVEPQNASLSAASDPAQSEAPFLRGAAKLDRLIDDAMSELADIEREIGR